MARLERFLGFGEVATLIGVNRDTLKNYKLPPHDAVIGTTRGWRESTIKAWHKARPSQQKKEATDG